MECQNASRIASLVLRFTLVAAGLIGAVPATLWAQPVPLRLNENCIVSVLNRNTRVRTDGTWVLPNIPANFGLVRARATCVFNGQTVSGESEPFLVLANGSVNVPPIALGSTTPIPTRLDLSANPSQLGTIGQTSQVNVLARFGDGSTQNVTAASTGTMYVISNPAIATITGGGLVTGLASGTALVQATHEGTSGFTSIRVVLSQDSDGDGIADDLELSLGLNPNNFADAFEDRDGDGLNNRDETNAGTNLNNPDTDSDGLLDGEEVMLGADGFITSPLLADTDGDGIRDGLEIASGSDPTNPASRNLAGALSSISAVPTGFTIIVNSVQGVAYTQLTVTGHLLDGTTLNLTSTTLGTNYSSSDLNVCNFGAPDGRVFGGSPGPCTITVTNSGFTTAVNGLVQNFSPRSLSSLAIPGYANNVDVNGGFAYVAAGSTGLQVVNVSNPAAPVIVASLDTPGNANDVKVVGTTAYVADGFSGLRMIDVSTPTSPVSIGVFDTPGEASDVVVAGTLAFVADGASGLQIISVANPGAPLLVRQVDTPGTARGVDVAGGVAVVADDTALRVIDITNPPTASIVGNLPLGGQIIDVVLNGGYAYIAAYTGGMHVVDVRMPNVPLLVGGLPGSAPNGFVPRDVQIAGQFALFAEQLFANAVAPIVDITLPTTPILRGVVDFGLDYAGTGLALAGPFVYWTGQSFVVGSENGSNGTTRLFIGQFLAQEDLAQVPPVVAIEQPAGDVTLIEGTSLTVRVSAVDDIAVSLVRFLVNGAPVFTDTSQPYEYTLTIPMGVPSVTIGAEATDLGNNVGTAANRIVSVIPDPLTTVVGRVVDANGTGLVGATVTVLGQTTTTGGDGQFLLTGVPTAQGNITASAVYTQPGGDQLSGTSAPVAPVAAGQTDVGTIVVVAVAFETNYGTFWTNCDDCFQLYTLPFTFPFFSSTYATAFVGSNGYITFDSGDTTFTETLAAFSTRPRISATFDDWYGFRSSGTGAPTPGVWVNATLPGRFVVTHERVGHFSLGGQNTFQITLFSDGRILFVYKTFSVTTSGMITGLTPGPNTPLLQVDFSSNTNFSTPAGTSVLEYFTNLNPFDLQNKSVLFTPLPGGGYNVRVLNLP